MTIVSKQHTKSKCLQLLLAVCLFISEIHFAYAQSPNSTQPQEMRLQSDVQGQRSQPKVLFILPWEENLGTQDLEIDDSLISEEDFLAPIDRTVFQRQLKMYKQLEIAP